MTFPLTDDQLADLLDALDEIGAELRAASEEPETGDSSK